MAKTVLNFNSSWLFMENPADGAQEPSFDDARWRSVNLPHDWSVEGAFDQNAPAYCRGAWLPAGRGAYRKRFTLPASLKNHRISVLFDGVFRNASVFLNGRKAGFRPWGYAAFECDLTEAVDFQGENLLAVLADNSKQPGTRWYSGSGIYRDVSLIARDCLHVPVWGVQVDVAGASAGLVSVKAKIKLRNASLKRAEVLMAASVLDGDGRELARRESPHVVGAGLLVSVEEELSLAQPKLWDLDSPALHVLRVELRREGRVVDVSETRFGIRELNFDPQSGFRLNGRRLKIKGCCLHNDGGALGAACFKRTFERQLRILKGMGCNAVRTAHHPFSETFLDACDELGMLVLGELFDEWQEPISVMPYSDGEGQRLSVDYYAGLFDQWAAKDLSDMIQRDRRHPSIFMWSIGNEIPQMHKSSGYALAARLQELVHNLDPRPVTCAATPNMSRYSDANIGVLDVAGYNYPSASLLDSQKARFPDRLMIVTEHCSAQTRVPRGERHPKGEEPSLPYRHGGAMNFIREHKDMKPGIEAWKMVAERDFVMGSFIWTGWDYLGEITPYDWPAHASFFGAIDICGFPKDGYFYCRSQWKAEPLVHLLTHWNWPEGALLDVKALSNCDAVELFVNGRSRGVRQTADALSWDLPFEAGELKAVGIVDGHPAAEDVVRTAGEPALLALVPWPSSVRAGAPDLVYLACDVLDSKGVPAPLASNMIEFEVSGPCRLRALDNGDPFDTTPFQGRSARKAFYGKCLAIAETSGEAGEISVVARAQGLLAAKVAMQAN